MVSGERALAVVLSAVVVLSFTAGVTVPSGNAADELIKEPGMESHARQASGITGEVDLADADSMLVGAAENDTSGWSVATGDVDGDGRTDLLIGAIKNDSGGENAGAAYLFYGPVDTGTVDLGAADATFVGEDRGDNAGAAVAIGDVDGDGDAGVVVGAPDNDTAATNAGAVYVHEVTADTSGEVSLGDADHKLLGEDTRDRAGYSVAVPENGSDEGALVVGAPFHDDDAGAAYLVRSPSGGTTSLADAQATLLGESEDDVAGFSVAFAGDVDGDGALDALVGAPGWQNDTGAAYLLSDVRSASGTADLAGADARFEGTSEGDEAGWAVAMAGDFDDDGLDDIVVGAPGNDSAGEDAGAAYVVSGASAPGGTTSLSDADVTYAGEAADDRAGFSVSSAGSGDVTCDAVDDVLVGAPGNDSTETDAGAAYIVTGGETGAESTNLGEATAKLRGEAADDWAGFAVADGGDLNADGDEDVVVGAPYHGGDSNHGENSEVGATYVVHGDCPDATETATKTPSPTETSSPTETKTPTKTKTPTETSSPTETRTPKKTPTGTPTETPTRTPTETETARDANQAPNAAFTVSDLETERGALVDFDASASADQDGSIVEYRWDFDGDGTVDETTDEPPIRNSFPLPGEYDVTLTVVDDDGATDTTSNTVTATKANALLNAEFESFNPRPAAGETVTFDATASASLIPDSPIVEFRWDFDGDGNVDKTTTDTTVEHEFSSPGEYDVTLTVVDEFDATDTTSKTLTVEEPTNDLLNAEFEVFHPSPEVGETVTFDAAASANLDPNSSIVEFRWDFDGDGEVDATSDHWEVDHSYSSPGEYEVELTIVDDDGATDSVSTTVTVEEEQNQTETEGSETETGESPNETTDDAQRVGIGSDGAARGLGMTLLLFGAFVAVAPSVAGRRFDR